MPAFIEECRHEWRRLGVPDSMAEEMAAELEADLAEAEADGVSAVEMLGESDPRRFAANWAQERGLVAPPRNRKRRRPWIAVALFLALVFVVVFALIAAATVTVHTHVSGPRAQTIPSVVIPNFVGLRACHARHIALETGLRVQRFPHGRCNAVVIAQQPKRGSLIPTPPRADITVMLRLAPRR